MTPDFVTNSIFSVQVYVQLIYNLSDQTIILFVHITLIYPEISILLPDFFLPRDFFLFYDLKCLKLYITFQLFPTHVLIHAIIFWKEKG